MTAQEQVKDERYAEKLYQLTAPPVGVERMLRIYLMQQWFNPSDPAAREAFYDSAAMRAFVGIDLGREAAPDETTICEFRHLFEAHDIDAALLAAINAHWTSVASRSVAAPL